jgi:hypothetical protein
MSKNTTHVNSDSDIISFAWVGKCIICCHDDQKTYLLQPTENNLEKKLIKENVLYSYFLTSQNKIYCARAFGGLDVLENGEFKSIYTVE